MGAAHHGIPGDFSPEEQRRQKELMERFIGQVEGRAKRNYSQGRIGANDGGDLAMAITADRTKNVVIIDFGKPVNWIGLPPEQVNGLVNLLMQKLRELGVPATINV